MTRALLKISLIKHEGRRAFPYLDTAGKTSIGVGRNLTDRGLRDDEVALLLNNDIDDAVSDAVRLVPMFSALEDARQRVIVEMVFNLGASRLAKFKKFLAAIDAGDYERAADEMLNSAWATQVGQRARTLARMMRDGN